MRSSSWWLPFGLLALSPLACNQILENKKGVLDGEAPATETSATQPPDAEDETATTPPGSSEEEAGKEERNAPRSSEDDAGGLCPRTAGAKAKSCGPLCVSVDDPLYGCAAADCSPCAVDGATPACVDGRCSISVCIAGRADCNNDATDGCEADLNALTSCGACGVACPLAPHALPACASLACALACDVGWADCNADPLDGCETDLTIDTANCGKCGSRCLIGRCAAGACAIF
ncbi:MAG TPA: hypothetical protein VM925_03425 [Labilithrix sp.]|nr:hypothetical protein [Labilithrix sp.]